jgi:L-aminoadipate-semialdehyde dehydrogenase
MPLNPNGKIDKPTLPFPDTAQAATAAPPSCKASATEKVMQAIWASILPSPMEPIPLDKSFFDLGGHSVLATRLIFQIRKVFLINTPLGLVFNHSTIAGLVAEVDALRNADLGLYEDADPIKARSATQGSQANKPSVTPVEYGQDYINLLPRLHESYSPLPKDLGSRPLTVFLTGATGFLGAFVLRELLSQTTRVKKVICLVRAADSQKTLRRLRDSSTDREVWDETWVTTKRLEVVAGDLTQSLLGLGEIGWNYVAAEADVIVHNGALVRPKLAIGILEADKFLPQVHWVYPYEKLRSANVLSTLTALELASTGTPKLFVFVSSTSAIDTEHYVQLSDSLSNDANHRGIPESDDLEGASHLLKTGYGQTKWVSEKLLFEAGSRGLRGHIIRPGYVVGDSHSAGECNFLVVTSSSPNLY